MNPEEKDALLYASSGGYTWAEDFGYADEKERPYFVSNFGDPYAWINYRAKDELMRRYEQFFEVQRPPQQSDFSLPIRFGAGKS